MRPYNPFLAHPRTVHALNRAAVAGDWHPELHEFPLLALELEALSDANPPFQLSEPLSQRVQWLTENAHSAPSLLLRSRIAFLLNRTHCRREIALRFATGFTLSGLLHEIYGIPETIGTRLQLMTKDKNPSQFCRPWKCPSTVSLQNHFARSLERRRVSIHLHRRWTQPFCVVTSSREAFLFADTLSSSDPFRVTALIHEMAHIEQLLDSAIALEDITPWQRELHAISAEHKAVCELSSPGIEEEWFRRTLDENMGLLREELKSIERGEPANAESRMPLSASLYAGAALQILSGG